MNQFFLYIFDKSQKYNFHTNTLGLVRSILAFSTLCVILLNPIDILFHTGLGVTTIPNCTDSTLSSFNFFCLFSFNLYIAKIVSIIILLFVIIGYYPKITGILHWWVALSVNTGLIIVDGGAQVASALTFLIIPLTLTDSRINHWNTSVKAETEYNKIIAYLAIQALKIQISFIYFDAAISKVFAPSWTEGTAIYYFINDPVSGVSGIRQYILNSFFNVPLFLVFSTYLIIFLELVLALSIFNTNQNTKKVLFTIGVVFHIFIFLIFGIFTFVVAMFSALIILFVPIYRNFNKSSLKLKT